MEFPAEQKFFLGLFLPELFFVAADLSVLVAPFVPGQSAAHLFILNAIDTFLKAIESQYNVYILFRIVFSGLDM